MSGELVRYNRNETSLEEVSDARRTMDAALAKLRGTSYDIQARKADLMSSGSMLAAETCEVVDVPRVCAVHNRYYVSRYVEDRSGSFRYGQSIRATTKSTEQYRTPGNHERMLPADALGEETCPWCGASGWAAILCGTCNWEVCYGRTTSDEYFQCRQGCTGKGNLMGSERATRGLRPSLASRPDPFSAG